MAIVWEDPPQRGDRERWTEVLQPLTQKPGTWARVAEKPTHSQTNALANSMRRGARGSKGLGNYVNVPPGRWEFTMRTVVDEDNVPHYYVYARYLGEEE